MKSARCITILVTLSTLIEIAGCQEQCPDLARNAMDWNTASTVDEGHLTVDIYEWGSDTPLVTQGQLSELAQLMDGVYDISFSLDDIVVGELTEVCTVGMLTGCEAEDAPADATPMIDITDEDHQVTVTLLSNGTCPQM